MTDIAPLNQGRFYWVLVRSSTKDPEWQPARFTGAAGHSPAAKWDFIGFNRDVGHHFVEIADIGPELDEGPLEVRGGARRAADGFLIKPGSAGGGRAPTTKEKGTHSNKGASDEHTHAITIAQERGGCNALAHVRPQPSDDRMDKLCNDRRMR
jgi:hypothetical protein